MDLLARLVGKSLAFKDAEGDRYRLLERVRQYARELVEASGEVDALRNRHLAFHEGLVERSRQEITGPMQGHWMTAVEREREDPQSAHAWCEHVPDGARLGLNLARGTKVYWINRGLLGVGHRLIVEALAHPGARERNEMRCRALFDAEQFGFYMGRYGEAQRYLEESLAIARETGDKARIAAALQPLGMAALGQGHLDTARTHLEEALALARELGDRRNLCAAMNAIAQLYRTEGALDKAEPLYENALAIARELDDRENVAAGLPDPPTVSISWRADVKGRACLRPVISIAEEIGSQRLGVRRIPVCPGPAALCQDWESTARFFRAAEGHNGSNRLHPHS